MQTAATKRMLLRLPKIALAYKINLARSMKIMSKIIQKEVRKRTPIKTGKMRKNIKIYKKSATSYLIGVNTKKVSYVYKQEFTKLNHATPENAAGGLTRKGKYRALMFTRVDTNKRLALKFRTIIATGNFFAFRGKLFKGTKFSK